MAGVVAPITSSSSSSSSSTTGTSSSSDSGTTDAINNLDLGSFLTLMIKELQNQDPLNPMDNSQMLTQLSEIRQVGSTDKLTSTLNSVLLGQNISKPTNLIGANITALSDDNQQVTGVVDKVSITDGTPKLHVASYPSLGTVAGSGDITGGSYKYQVVWQDSTGSDRARLLGPPDIDNRFAQPGQCDPNQQPAADFRSEVCLSQRRLGQRSVSLDWRNYGRWPVIVRGQAFRFRTGTSAASQKLPTGDHYVAVLRRHAVERIRHRTAGQCIYTFVHFRKSINTNYATN